MANMVCFVLITRTSFSTVGFLYTDTDTYSLTHKGKSIFDTIVDLTLMNWTRYPETWQHFSFILQLGLSDFVSFLT